MAAAVGVFLLGGAAIAIGYVSRRYLAGLIQYVQPAQQLLTDVKQDIFDVAVAEEVNPEHTKGMENTHRAIMPYLGETTCGYFAVFDGHNGVEVAEMSARYLHEKLELQIKEMREVRQGLDKCFEIAYEQMDDGLRICRAECGTAAVTCMLRKESDTAVRLCAANAGDCRAVLCRAGLAFRVTRDHKPDDEDEKRRIEAAKGFVARGRVNSFLSVRWRAGEGARVAPRGPVLCSVSFPACLAAVPASGLPASMSPAVARLARRHARPYPPCSPMPCV
mmetsp:Transcript_67578/g.180615  ORF Transcript_67578/g.180615 Transcript_67578/m.180615 type:complete len:277 (-) Transcript_67578:64-894(-)